MTTASRSAAAISALCAALAVAEDAPKGRETFTAFAVSLGGPTRPSGSGTVLITVDRWSTPEERRALVSAFKEKGPDGLRDALQKVEPLGRIRTPDSIGYDLRYAHQVPLPGGGRRILLGTERPISARELIAGARSTDYPFTVVEMRLDAKGEGQGKLSIATRVVSDGDAVELENYDMAPVQLTKIRAKRE
ncbi:MAG TPA: hypothetical protein VFR81_19295 [Longimicrobium sp.]|nr:hypothetical protein [Longimicrobium sp.]